MNDLGPIKSIIKSKNVTPMKNGRMRIRNLVTASNLPFMGATASNHLVSTTATTANMATATAETLKKEDAAATTKETKTREEYTYVPPAAKRFYLCNLKMLIIKGIQLKLEFLTIVKHKMNYQLLRLILFH
jgi:hypothetical protein